jgi:1-acyl-sn-glycerol-3-phosphate acyltransferase
MLRVYYVIALRIFSIMRYVPKMAHYARHPETYDRRHRYRLAQKVINKVRKTARVNTEYYGMANLPEKNGYLMFANHQGKYDALGIFAGHREPCSVLMDKKRSNMFIAKQFIDMLGGQRIEKNSPRQQIRALNNIAEELKSGVNYLIFPEGGYPKGRKRQDNSLIEFKYGCFTCAVKAKCPVVPVVLLDSYKAFGKNNLRRVTTKVIFLPPILPEEYEGMRAKELCEFVRVKIDKEIRLWEKTDTYKDRKPDFIIRGNMGSHAKLKRKKNIA